MTRWPLPPPLARWLLERALPADVREAVSGDLDEVFQRDCETSSLGSARLRYWRKTVSFTMHFVIERWRDRRRGGVMGAGMSWLDVKLGLRMLVRYPGLSLAGAFAIALVVVCGAAAAAFDAVVNGTLPFEEGDRVVAIENWDTSANTPQPRALHDFVSWRSQLTTIEDVGAYRLITRNVTAAGRSAEPVRIAETSAAAFRVARVPPLLGRYLLENDELEGAPPVIVIGYSEWQRRFDGDPQVVGRTILVGDTTSSVVGVMPDGFGFPEREGYWTPLRLNPSNYARGLGPVIYVFGRLADAADLAAAQAELTVVGQRGASDFPDTHARLRPRVLPYTNWFFAEMHDGETFALRILVALLLGIVGANVAVLVYARTATRRIEMAVRSALGASRRRIVWQMFVEGLALSGMAAVAGLVMAGIMRAQLSLLIEQAPFWVDTSLMSARVVVYVLTLTVLGAVIIGVVPALQATGRRAQTGLRHAASSMSRWRLGRSYGALMVVQVAFSVAILPFAVSTAWTSIQQATVDPGFAAEEFLTARLAWDRESADASARFRDRQAELVRRLESEPGVSDVTLLTGRPGNEPRGRIEVESGRVHEVGVDQMGADFRQVGVDFLKAFGIPILAGRSFDARDLDPSTRHVIVNRTFAQRIIGGNAVGRRVREMSSGNATRPGPWLEIVGVVGDFPAMPMNAEADEATMYHPVGRGNASIVRLALRVHGGSPTGLASRLRDVTAALDPSLQISQMKSMDVFLREPQIESRLAASWIGLITLSVLLLSATGLYALMAFTVTQRRREVGIRLALGADPWRILSSIMSRAFWQLTIGTAAGAAIAAYMDLESDGELTGSLGMGMLLPAVAVFVLFVGLIAAAQPARRGLRIQPTEALREA